MLDHGETNLCFFSVGIRTREVVFSFEEVTEERPRGSPDQA